MGEVTDGGSASARQERERNQTCCEIRRDQQEGTEGGGGELRLVSSTGFVIARGPPTRRHYPHTTQVKTDWAIHYQIQSVSVTVSNIRIDPTRPFENAHTSAPAPRG